MTGSTTSVNFPTTPGAFQPTFGGATDFALGDAFVAKLNPTGSALVYSTYLGGSNDDAGSGIAVDGAGNAYVAGFTASANFPTTPGAFQDALAGGLDAFIVKLNSGGCALISSTYLGGRGDDAAFDVAIDRSSPANAYVTGPTTSSDFPTTRRAFQTGSSGGWDGFVTNLVVAGDEGPCPHDNDKDDDDEDRDRATSPR